MTPTPPTSDDNLLPCPWCGKAPIVDKCGERGSALHIYCGNIKCRMGMGATTSNYQHQIAIDDWNTRQASRLPHEKLVRALKECSASFKLYDSETGQISFEALAREFNRRQTIAGKALSQEES